MSVALPLPPALAAALDADGEILVRHPTTGAQLRLVPGPASGRDGAGADRPAGSDRFFDSGETLAEEVDAAIAEADAGLGVSWEEHLAGRDRRLADLLRRNGHDPTDHMPPEALGDLDE